jgi:hypothetical protein
MSSGTLFGKPIGDACVTGFKTTEFSIREVLLDRFLEKDYVNIVLAEVILKKGATPQMAEPSDVPDKASH